MRRWNSRKLRSDAAHIGYSRAQLLFRLHPSTRAMGTRLHDYS